MVGLKFRLSFTFLVLLAAGMLLVNLVVMLLWQRDVLHREGDRCGLEHRRATALLAANPTLGAETLSRILDLPQGSCVAVVDLQGSRSMVPESCPHESVLASQVRKSLDSGRKITRFSGSAWGVFSSRSRVIIATGPLRSGSSLAGVVAIAHSLDPAFHRLQRTEKIILVYILINLVILGVIGFFRMSDLVIRPIERLIDRADRYVHDEDLLFASDREGSEFHRLGTSLKRLVNRIEADRRSLRKAVDRLGQANRKLQENQQEMIRTEKLASVGRLAAGLAHEIGNPLGIVQGYLGILGQDGTDRETRRECRIRAEEELRRVTGLIRQLLDFARTSKGEKEPVAVQGILMEVLEMMQQPLVSGISLETDLQAEQDTVLADGDQLRQVFLNCLLNGVDAIRAADRGEAGCLTVATENVAGREGKAPLLVIRICDNGIGIEEKTLNNIFDPFFTTKEPGQGTGLGLSVSLAIVEALGGAMEMTSEVGRGSEMRISLPVVEEKEETADANLQNETNDSSESTT